MMQKVVIVAGALGVLASGTAIPEAKRSHSSKVREGIRAQELAVRASWSGDTDKKTSMSVESKLAAEGESLKKVRENDGTKYFEMTYGQYGCRTDGGYEWEILGYEMNSCKDYLWRYDEDGDMAHGESLIYVMPRNGGFPIGMWFTGHGCKGEPQDVWRMDKTDEYFPRNYKTGTCIQNHEEDDDWADGSAYFVQARWTDEKHDPAPGTRAWGDNTRQRPCSKDRFYEYEFWRYSTDCRTYWRDHYTEECTVDMDDLVDFDPDDDHYMSIEFTTDRCTGYQSTMELL